MCQSKNTAYHLFSVDPHCLHNKGSVKLIRRSNWHLQYNIQRGKFYFHLRIIKSFYYKFLSDNAICGLDFDPLGVMTASIDTYDACFISNLNTNEYIYHKNMSIECGNLIECCYSRLKIKSASLLADHSYLISDFDCHKFRSQWSL